MKPRARRRLGLVLVIAGVLVLVLATGSLYLSSRPAPLPAFGFLAGQEPWHSDTRKTARSSDAVTAYHDSVCYSARKELVPLGYAEITRRIDYSSAGGRFDPRDRRIPVMFRRQAGRTSTNVRIAKGRFLEVLPNGNLRFGGELDWVHVVVTQSRLSLWQVLRRWWSRWAGKAAPAPPPGPFPPVPSP